MGSYVMIAALFLGTVYGIFYLFVTSRHRERLALIEKGADGNIFVMDDTGNLPIWKVILLNFSLLFISIGAGIFIGSIVENNFGLAGGIAYSGTIFLTAGIGLFAGFMITSKLDKKD